MNEPSNADSVHVEAPGQLVGLIVMTVVGTLGAIVCWVVAIMIGSARYLTDSDLAITVGLGWWSNFGVTVAAVSFVGSLVLAGTHRLLMRR
ncbi:hypothetical protein [Microbacterium mcarthurae (nom. nud.)]|uniref:Uncharacterized protein n=1 Tax=Microbacterium mcarthurae TaxID=3035918 RepID=A0ABW9GFE0_9MICO